MAGVLRIRNATATEGPALEALQRRSSDVWPQYREQLAANPDAIELPQAFIDKGWVRVAVDGHERTVGFSVVIPSNGPVHELDGLFVEPAQWNQGIGRALIADALAIARGAGAQAIETVANPRAEGFYIRLGFAVIGQTQTQFGPANRMRIPAFSAQT